MTKVLTTAAIEKLKADPNKRREIPDGRLPGLYLVIQPSGRKSWAVRYRYGDKPRKLTLDGFPSLGMAHKLAQEALDTVAQGGDPAAAKVETKRAEKAGVDDRDQFEKVCRQFVERYAAPKNRSWKETARTFGLVPDRNNKEPGAADDPAAFIVAKDSLVAKWGSRKIGEIRKRDVIDLLDSIVDRGAPTAANRTLAAVRKLFNWCVSRDMLQISPCAGVKPPAPETSRERVLTDDEIRWLWKAAEGQDYPFGQFAMLLLLTGQRRDEVAGMTVGEVDLAERVWSIPKERAKNNRAHEVALSDAAVTIFESLPKIAGAPGYLFTTNGRTHVRGYSRAKSKSRQGHAGDCSERGSGIGRRRRCSDDPAMDFP